VNGDPTSPATSRTLAFLFTDVEGSTRLWERFPDGMRASLSRHDRILRGAVEGRGGRVVKTTGDGVMAIFGTARDGLVACLAAQVALRDEAWGETGPLRVRMGLHVGEGAGAGEDYHGPAVNRAARIMAAGHGGQVLLSGPTAALAIDQMPAGASLRDLGEHRLKDLARPERVFQLVHADLPEAFPPLATVDVRARSLPPEPSAFVGREAERARVAERLTDEALRLLTLTGPGGIGKTRLALCAARDVEHRFAAGAVFVDLSEARDAAALLTTIARALGLADSSEDAQLGDLVAHVGQQRLLMVLDNFEQVSATAPTLARLLQGCPGLTLLVTSREPLHVRGEHLFVVPPLGLPDPSLKAPTAEQVEGYEAVRLFVERAQAVRPDFRVTDENAAVLADICRRLEGVPLAIELATARLRVFSLDTLRDRLDSRLRALGGGARDLPERQQTLRATIDWSYQLLTPAEQRLLEVTACFQGADAEAVEDVARMLGERLSGIDPIDGLVSLADKSLLRQGDRDGEEPRFEMLESVREYALERLEADPALAREARAAHAAHYARWADDAGAGVGGPRRTRVLARLAVELENLRAAWRWSVAAGDLEGLEALMRGLRPLYDVRGWYRGLTDLLDDMLALLEAMPPSPERSLLAATLRTHQARALTAMQGYTAEVEAAYERLLGSVEGADVTQVYPVLRVLASLHQLRGEHVRTADLARRIIRLAEDPDDPLMRADGHLMLGTSLAFAGRIEDGIPDLEAAIGLFEANPHVAAPEYVGPAPHVTSLTAASLLYWSLGRLDRSLERSERAVALALELQHPSTMGYAIFHSALLRLWRGEPGTARERAVHVIAVAEEHELHIWKAVGTVVLGASAVALGSGDEGLVWITDGLEQYRGLRTPPIFWTFLLGLWADACARTGRTDEGLGAIGEALGLAPRMPELHLVRGDLLRAAGDVAEADVEYELALEAARGWGAPMSELRAAIRRCRTAASSDPVEGDRRRGALRTVLDTFSEGLDAPDLLEAAELLRTDA
jgi:predicted ATPase/class 3 adenylate cyclase